MLKWIPKVWRTAAALIVLSTGAVLHAYAQATPAIPIAPRVAPHPLAQGMPVVDLTGAAVGVITAIADSDRGPMVVVKADGRLISLPQASLTLDGAVVRSSQTRAQILAAAGR